VEKDTDIRKAERKWAVSKAVEDSTLKGAGPNSKRKRGQKITFLEVQRRRLDATWFQEEY
jgi:hypothetical protein